jgi:tetratricopeptide (TPR) repeat protein
MATPAPVSPISAAGAVFLSYAREDATAAQRVAEVLRSHGVEVWFDQNELRGGDAWDQKIRRQIGDCALFMPIISRNTQERGKGYFRLEWKLAVEQTHLMAEGMPFLAPVVVDDTTESGAVVPPEFLRVQWTRLPDALPTPQFVEQMKRLLDGPKNTVVAVDVAGRGRGTPPTVSAAESTAGFGDPALHPKPRVPGWMWGALAVAVVVVVGGAVAFLALRPSAKESAPPAAAAKPPTPPQTEAHQLAAKAWALWEKADDATRDDWTLADQLCQRAVSLDPTDGDVWAAQAQVSLAFIIFGFDMSPARYEATRAQAERAVRLAPDSIDAQFALANYYRRVSGTREEGVRRLRQLVERAPIDKRILRALASGLRGQGRNEESIVFSDRAIALPGGDPIAMFGEEEALRNLNRIAESESIIDQALAVRPTPAGYLKKLYFVLNIHGDLEQARALVEKMPAPVLLDEWGAAHASQVWLWRREPQKAIAVLNAVPKDFLEKGNLFTGPKAYLTGLAQQLAGNTEAASADWQAALQVVEGRLKDRPNSVELVGWRARLLARLGERAEAERALRVFEQLMQSSPTALGLGTSNRINIMALVGRQDEAIDELTKIYSQPPPALRYSPEWDVLRGNPRFEAWLKQTEQKK